MSIDFCVPSHAVDAINLLNLPTFPIPLLLLEKKALVALDVRSEDDIVLPTLTRSQNGAIAESALRSMLKARLNLDTVLDSDIHSVVFGSGVKSGPLFTAIEAMIPADDAEKELIALVKWVALSLADQFVLAIDMPVSDLGKRRIVTISYEVGDQGMTLAKRENNPVDRAKRFFSWFGLLASSYRISTPEIANCESYHFEFRPPVGLQIDDMAFEASGDPKAIHNLGNRGYRMMPSICHAVTNVELSGNRLAELSPVFGVRVSVIPSSEGMILASFLTGCLASTLLLFGVHSGSRLLTLPSDPSVALLLVAPGAVSALLTRPDEHILASRLLRGVRLLALTPGLATFAAAALLALKPSTRDFVNTWRLFSFLSVFSTGLLGLVALRGLLASRRNTGKVKSQ